MEMVGRGSNNRPQRRANSKASLSGVCESGQTRESRLTGRAFVSDASTGRTMNMLSFVTSKPELILHLDG